MTFEEVYQRHFAYVWRTLRYLGVRAADLPDVTQDVFVTVHRQLPEYEPRAKITTWLFRLCMTAAHNHRRLARFRRESLEPTNLEARADAPLNPTARLERDEDLALFNTALDALDPDQRAAFVLFELAGISGPDLAETLEIPLGTVHSRLRLAREAFRRAVLRERARRDTPVLRVRRSR